MSALPTLNIPVVVNTAQVEPAMKKVEKTVADSAARIGKIRTAMMPGLGALGAGPAGGVLGGLGGLGGGPTVLTPLRAGWLTRRASGRFLHILRRSRRQALRRLQLS